MNKNYAVIVVVLAATLVVGFAGNASAGFLDSVRELFVRPAPDILPEPEPVTEITVTSPNGGETWTKGNTHKVTWSVNQGQVDQWFNQLKTENPTASAIVPAPRSLRVLAFLVDEDDDDPVILENDSEVRTQIYPLPPQPSVVLLIGNAGLFDRSLTWRIPESVATGSHYKVRLVVSWYPMPYMMDQMMGERMPSFYPRRILSDESDTPFSIVARDEPTPEPVDVQQLLREVQSLRQQVAAMQKAISQMSSAIDTLERIIRSLIGR
jgi:hypothetical protein